MENKAQYKQSDDAGDVRVSDPKNVITRTSTDIKMDQLENQIASQHQLILKLRRDINRLKNDISDVISMLNNRG